MLAECIVTVGAMLIPLAIVLLTTIKNFPIIWAQSLIVLGAIALIVGLLVAIRNEIRATKNEIRATKRERRLEKRDTLRRRSDKANLILLTHMANELGVDMSKVVETMESKLDKELDDEL